MNYEKLIIIDTCTYFRLSKELHPLLSNRIGKEKYQLCIIKDIYKDLKRNNQLKNKFFWIEEKEYTEDRKNNLFKEKASFEKDLNNNYNFILLESKQRGLSLSDVDINCINYAYTYGTKLATDDTGMIEIGNEFNVKIFKSLGILYIMYQDKQINERHIKRIIEYWEYLNDLPKEYHKEFKNLFGIIPEEFKKKY